MEMAAMQTMFYTQMIPPANTARRKSVSSKNEAYIKQWKLYKMVKKTTV